jgi:hypothetical protein
MNETELALAALAKATVDFLATMDGVGAEEYLVSPGPGRWSLAENAEHTTVVIRGAERFLTTRLLHQPLAAGDPSRRVQDADLLKFFTDRTRSLDAPEFVRPKGRWTNREEMTSAIRAATSGIVAWVRETPADLRAFGLPHPIFGPLDGIQWINFLALHTDRHAKQALEIRVDLARA